MDSTLPDFENAESVVADPLRFKAQLGIGENAYASLRLKNAAFEAWDAVGVGATGAAVAASPVVATTFFASTGFWASIGLGAAATTPIGWVVLAGVVSGGAWLGLTRTLKGSAKSRVTVVPHYINTPMDVLALGLFDLMAPLGLKVAAIDGALVEEERGAVAAYFVEDWGYDPAFVRAALGFTEAQLDGFTIKGLAQALAEFKRANPDCDYGAMSSEIMRYVARIAEADGPVDEAEELAIEKIGQIFQREGRASPWRWVRSLPGRAARLFRRSRPPAGPSGSN